MSLEGGDRAVIALPASSCDTSATQVPNFQYRSIKGMDPKFLRNQRFAKRWSKVEGGRPGDGDDDDDEEEEES